MGGSTITGGHGGGMWTTGGQGFGGHGGGGQGCCGGVGEGQHTEVPTVLGAAAGAAKAWPPTVSAPPVSAATTRSFLANPFTYDFRS
ncbi:hypothetical protein [Yinghuangia soli]|uniref:Uncharacterized protein n=1 Tax=Yinghuangia soli TaxID=2908204 RepID=A0AA41U2T0_9ACTN|nr:hypothetical protein [Yinghuangia soli]MCF2532093.1 hypothetical protein [Yinghuangia soli]